MLNDDIDFPASELFGGTITTQRYVLPERLEKHLADMESWGVGENSHLWTWNYPFPIPVTEERRLLVAIKALVAKMERRA